jgi:hypothetical protein
MPHQTRPSSDCSELGGRGAFPPHAPRAAYRLLGRLAASTPAAASGSSSWTGSAVGSTMAAISADG